MSLFENIKKRGLKDLLRPKKWWIYFRYLRSKYWRSDEWGGRDPLISKDTSNHVPEHEFDIDPKLLKEYKELTNRHELEQIAWRMNFRDCSQCLRAGKCVHCGCKSPELFYDRTNECSAMNWFEMLDKEAWNEFKAIGSVIIDPDYIEQIKKHGEIIKFKD